MCLICRSATVWGRNVLQFRGPLWGLWKKEKSPSLFDNRTPDHSACNLLSSMDISGTLVKRKVLYKMDVVDPINLCTNVDIQYGRLPSIAVRTLYSCSCFPLHRITTKPYNPQIVSYILVKLDMGGDFLQNLFAMQTFDHIDPQSSLV